MGIKIDCPECGKDYDLYPALAGQTLDCIDCGKQFTVSCDEAVVATPESTSDTPAQIAKRKVFKSGDRRADACRKPRRKKPPETRPRTEIHQASILDAADRYAQSPIRSRNRGRAALTIGAGILGIVLGVIGVFVETVRQVWVDMQEKRQEN